MTGTSNTLASHGQALELKMTRPPLTSSPLTRPSDPLGAAANRYRREVAGFTLIELMVSVSIMAIIALAFGGLMTQANMVVTEGEKRMRSDATASAISRIVRSDIRKITKNGFFYIEDDKLVLVTAGRTLSSFSKNSNGQLIVGDGAIIIYGRDKLSEVLYRKVLVLAKGATEVDCLPMSLTEVQVMSLDEMKNLIAQVSQEPVGMAYPPVTLSQVVNTMWMVLAGSCTELVIECHPPERPDWSDNVLSTRHDQTVWPDAIKFTFQLKPGTIMSKAIAGDDITEDDIVYEILCPVGH